MQEIYVNWIAGANPRLATEEGTRLVNQFVEIIPQLPALRRFMYVHRPFVPLSLVPATFFLSLRLLVGSLDPAS